MKLLLTLEPRWRDPDDQVRPHPGAPAADIAEALCQRLGARLLAHGDGDGETRLAVDTADGRNVLVRVAGDQIRLLGASDKGGHWDDEHDEWIEDSDADAALVRCVEALVPVLVELTGWRVDGDIVDYDTEGYCPQCERPYYEFETTCRDCGFRVDGSIAPEECLRRAVLLLDRLVARGLVELEDGRPGVPELLRRVARHIEQRDGHMDPDAIFRLLESCEGIAEVYGEEDELIAVWRAALSNASA